jgi:hypothetical protein
LQTVGTDSLPGGAIGKACPATKNVISNIDTVIAETLAGKGNITSSVKLSADELLNAGEQFLGSGYREIV